MGVTSLLGPRSRFKDTPLYRAPQTAFYGLWMRPEEVSNLLTGNVSTYTVRDIDVGRLDKLAYDRYGDVEYWWVIAAVNNIMDPRTDMYTGQVLVIPDYLGVQSMLNRAGMVNQ